MNIPHIKLAGKCIVTSFAKNSTKELWNNFIPDIKNIPNKVDDNKFSVQVYPNTDFFNKMDLNKLFKEYAAVQVSKHNTLPDDLEKLVVPTGKYAIFDYIGRASEASKAFQYILLEWLPKSKYLLDDRPHFCKMGAKYKGEHPESEEEIFIPITE